MTVFPKRHGIFTELVSNKMEFGITEEDEPDCFWDRRSHWYSVLECGCGLYTWFLHLVTVRCIAWS